MYPSALTGSSPQPPGDPFALPSPGAVVDRTSSAGGLAALSLPKRDQTLTRERVEAPPCWDGASYGWCVECDQWFMGRCRANGCAWCGPINARQTAGAIALARPVRSYLLTLVGEDWQAVRARVNRFRYVVRQGFSGWEDCWHVEPNPSGDGQHHVHGLAWGPYVPVERFRGAARRVGLGEWVGLRRVRQEDAAAMYGVKLAALSAAAYSLKGVGQDLETFLQANGGRMVHASRRFWRDSGGASLPGVRVARRVAAQRVAEGDLCPATGERHVWSGGWIPGVLGGVPARSGGPSGVRTAGVCEGLESGV